VRPRLAVSSIVKSIWLSRRSRSDKFRKSLKQAGIRPVIPGRSDRKTRIRCDKQAHRGRNVVEHGYCRLRDFRRIARRYDNLARNYFSALCLFAAVVFWLWAN